MASHEDTTTSDNIKLCECGCGMPAPIATQTSRRWKTVKGEPQRFIAGHWARTRTPKPAVERFWKHVRKSEGCWEWARAMKDGYGVFGVYGTTVVRAHRYSYELFKGPIPDGLFVCHHCDNRKCVRPDHLFLGTAKDNADDMWRKGRGPVRSGELASAAKLTLVQVRAMRTMRHAGATLQQIADAFGVSNSHTCRVVNGQKWKEASDASPLTDM
jgi:hypothetical protein